MKSRSVSADIARRRLTAAVFRGEAAVAQFIFVVFGAHCDYLIVSQFGAWVRLAATVASFHDPSGGATDAFGVMPIATAASSSSHS